MPEFARIPRVSMDPTSRPARNPLEVFEDRWKGCTLCSLHEGRANVVLCRGVLPCDVLVVGEAPGHSENVLGEPFVGPAGRVLDHILKESVGVRRACLPCRKKGEFRLLRRVGDVGNTRVACSVGHGVGGDVRVAITNLICCLPRDPNDKSKYTEPPRESILACQGRLAEFCEIARPRLLVAVGTHAQKWLDHKYKESPDLPYHWEKQVEVRPGKFVVTRLPKVDIVHPAAILRANEAEQEFRVHRSIVVISNAVDEVESD